VNVTLRYFARLREQLGCDSEQAELPGTVATVADLLLWLRARGQPWSEALAAERAFRVAVNQDLAQAGTLLAAGDEVALFPPVTGG
jgi:sulfur-carrier protein